MYKKIPYSTVLLQITFMIVVLLHLSSNSTNAAAIDSKSTTSATVKHVSASSSAPLHARKKTTSPTSSSIIDVDNSSDASSDDDDENLSLGGLSEFLNINIKKPNNYNKDNKNSQKKKDQQKKNKKQPNKKKVENSEDNDDLFGGFTQGYKKVYKKIQHWWKDLESSFSATPITYEGPSKKVKKDTDSTSDKQPKIKPAQKKPAQKKKPPPKKKDNQKQREPESWFDLNKIVLILGSIVTVLDLFGIR